MASKDVVTIKRWKEARSRFATGPGAAWNWRYDVFLPDGREVVKGTDRLATARDRAKDAAGRWSTTHAGERPPVVEEWKKADGVTVGAKAKTDGARCDCLDCAGKSMLEASIKRRTAREIEELFERSEVATWFLDGKPVPGWKGGRTKEDRRVDYCPKCKAGR